MTLQRLAASIALALPLAFSLLPSVHAKDAAGCTDPALFTNRIPGYSIVSCKKSNDAVVMRWPGGQQQVMGLVNVVVYKVPAAAQGASPKYIAANYANAVTKIGGKLLQDPAKTTLGDRVTAQLSIDGKDVWRHLTSDSAVVDGNWLSYKLVVVQQDAGAQVVSAQKMLDELDKAGFLTLYINFDINKADIKPDSHGTVQEIVGLLRARPALKVSIEGHTDNVGAPAANKTLSEQRARSVLEAVVGKASSAPASRAPATGRSAPSPTTGPRKAGPRIAG
ncbi:MAG: OmpA family protein [Aquabacterium sp.]|jgi:OmpA-OmpF porin, OOP family|uniref:OmpA family protein n=1 Tax=Aquabacterium sp. TaxID=1872578 RepID=UPI003BAEDE75